MLAALARFSISQMIEHLRADPEPCFFCFLGHPYQQIFGKRAVFLRISGSFTEPKTEQWDDAKNLIEPLSCADFRNYLIQVVLGLRVWPENHCTEKILSACHLPGLCFLCPAFGNVRQRYRNGHGQSSFFLSGIQL